MKSIFDEFDKVAKEKGLSGKDILFRNKNIRAYKSKKSYMNKEDYKNTSFKLAKIFLYLTKQLILSQPDTFYIDIDYIGKLRKTKIAQSNNRKNFIDYTFKVLKKHPYIRENKKRYGNY